jgi:peptide deformylase
MPIRKIIQVEHPVLRSKAQEVKSFDEDLQNLIDDMVETMREAPGVGLAAPQVNVSQRLIVVEFGIEANDEEQQEEVPKKLHVVINPEISRASSDMIVATEGCLSVPEWIGDVERSSTVTIKGKNRRGQPLKIKSEGWLARIFQHEIDHVNGILFLDRAESIYKPEPEEDLTDPEGASPSSS